MAGRPYAFGTIGIGGYAGMYLLATEYLEQQAMGRLVAAVVRSPQKYAEKVAALEAKGVRIYQDLSAMLAKERLDVVGVPTSISSHVPYSIAAMEAGCDVICEKPLCATVQDAEEMVAARDRWQRRVAIGYQAMHHPISHEVKRRLVAGELGRIKRIRCKISAPRPDAYYSRNDWAGRQKDSAGRWILDSPANNANAHQLQQMLFYAGPAPLASADPVRVLAELYHGRPDIDNFDTCAIRVETREGVELLYVASHCVAEQWGPVMVVECERGTVEVGWGAGGGKGPTRILHADGRIEEVAIEPGVPNLAFRTFTNMVGAIEGSEALLCTPDNTRQQTLVINAAHDSCGGPSAVPLEFSDTGELQYGSQRLPGRFIKGAEDAIARCYEEGKTFSELGLPWARPSRWVETTDYHWFPGGRRP